MDRSWTETVQFNFGIQAQSNGSERAAQPNATSLRCRANGKSSRRRRTYAFTYRWPSDSNSRRGPPSLSRNRPHVFPDHLHVPGLRIAEVGPDDEHVAGVAEREVRLVFETDSKVQCSVLDGMGDEVHDLTANLGISLAQPLVALLYPHVDLPAFHGADRGYRRAPDPHDLRLFWHGHSSLGVPFGPVSSGFAVPRPVAPRY